jgi:hypothetical protein
MEHVAQHHFDVVVACEKLAGGYTGLELLSEVEAVSPTTLRIFAARPETLKRLGKRLDLFGLLGTLHYPIEARKLLVALKVARGKLPGRPKPPKVKHVVLENEWDTGERLALLGQELEDAPPPAHEEPAPSESVAHEYEHPAIPEHATVERARHIAEASSFEVSFEVSFDENPSRYDVTGHGGKNPVAEEFGPEWVAPEELSPFGVPFDENPTQFAPVAPVAIASPVAPPAPVASATPVTIANPVIFSSDEPFEEAPSPVTAEPAENEPYFDSSAANDEIFSDKPPVPQAHGDTTRGKTLAAASKSPAPPKQNAAKGPRPRKPTVPSAAQREAFQRALARRNAARAGGFVEEPPIDFSSMGSMSAAPAQTPTAQSRMGSSSSQSLASLARMATTKRPLPGNRSTAKGIQRSAQPKRRVFVVGSGIAAVLLAAVVCFELLRATPPGEHGRHTRSANAQLFSPPPTLVADNSAGSPEVFTPAPPEPAQTSQPGTDAAVPQPQTFNPDTAPPDPPPPPALEQPGQMEPPSMGHHRPPWAPQGGADTE